MDTNTKRMQAVYAVVPKPEGKDVWLRVGSAFPNRDGSITVLLDAIPTNGRLQIRDYQPRDGAHVRGEAAHAREDRANDAGEVHARSEHKTRVEAAL